MTQPNKHLSFTACALAVSLFLAACGGGDPTTPPDTTPPTVAITDSVPAPTATGPVTFTFTFSEDVGTSFTAEDIVVTGGTAGALVKVNATVYTLVVTPPPDATGTITVSVPVGRFRDLALNDNVEGATASQAFDTTPATPPPATGTVLANFDSINPAAVNAFEGAVATVEAAPEGGSGNALKILRDGGQPWAGVWIPVPTVATGDGTVTISARVFSPTAGIPMVAKLEYDDNQGSGDRAANETVVAGWQTLTWTFSGLDATRAYNRFVMLPNLMTVGTGQAYFFDDITVVGGQATEPPPATTTVLVDFDAASPASINAFEGAVADIAAGPAGGIGNALRVTRSGGQPWAGAWIPVPAVPTTPSTAVITARVFSPKAGIRMTAKLEYGDNQGSGEREAAETVVEGWQTLTWTFPNLDATRTYDRFVVLPDFMTVGTGESYYFDDITLTSGGQAGGGGGGGGGDGGTPNPGAPQGSAGPVQIPVLTAPDSIGFATTGEALFAGDYRGALDQNNNNAGWTGATTRGLASNGNIGYFQSNSLSTSPQKLEENGWVVGTLDNPGGVPNFFRFYILTAPAASFNDAYFGMFVNAPNNGTVDVSQYGSIKFRLWGPAEMYQAGNFNPTLELTLTGAKVEGCTATGSGGTEIKKTFVANQKIGAASTYKLPLAAWTVVGVCGTDTPATAVASVLGALARVVIVVPGTSFNFTNINPDNLTYTSGVNLGPIAFTND